MPWKASLAFFRRSQTSCDVIGDSWTKGGWMIADWWARSRWRRWRHRSLRRLVKMRTNPVKTSQDRKVLDLFIEHSHLKSLLNLAATGTRLNFLGKKYHGLVSFCQFRLPRLLQGIWKHVLKWPDDCICRAWPGANFMSQKLRVEFFLVELLKTLIETFPFFSPWE